MSEESNVRHQLKDPLFIVLSLILFFAPTQLGFNFGGVNISLVDPLIAIGFLLFAIRCFGEKQLGSLIPTTGVILFILAIALSGIAAHEKSPWIVELLQCIEYFAIVPLLFSRSIVSPIQRQVLLYIALLSLSIILLWGSVEYLDSSRNALDVAASFSNRNTLGIYLGSMLPLLWALVVKGHSWRNRLLSAILFTLGFMMILSGGALIGAFLGVTLVSLLIMPRWAPLFLLILMSL